ncbi:hypothetical protein QT196_36910 [Streptomyces sp. P9-2B-2]|uniref:hypothetical protein n=1 Tax=Streptomyces TaxID=1883 RepID=UPI002254A926|nr:MULTISPECIES: hypothetical protein [Streptomyces]MCX4638808.1 hypothetical protein [Streptomyces platensis]WJY42389.1 hypothetical protein QT196_36910 [Streptomyces sp. P9-2B-2]
MTLEHGPVPVQSAPPAPHHPRRPDARHHLVPNATLKLYPGAPHGLSAVGSYKDDFPADPLEFLKS